MNSSGNEEPTAASSYVLDASAVLAVILEEPGREIVMQAIERGATIGSINLAEVITRLVRLGMSDERIAILVGGLRLRIEPLEAAVARDAGLMSRVTSPFGLSLGDRCCLALAKQLGLPALTADRRWSELQVGIRVELLR